MRKFLTSENALLSNAKATYYPMPDGSLKLARVQVFSTPKFMPDGWEVDQKKRKPDPAPVEDEDLEEELEPLFVDRLRATRRARRNAFDLIMCNGDLNGFATFTIAPDSVNDKGDYGECYRYLRSWLSNGVQRDGLKYICVPELTKKGDVHFHAICNAEALRLSEARSAKTGRLLLHGGDQVYNITNWKAGFSTAQIIRRRNDEDDPRQAVAKYIFKYMGKNLGAKVGGRYMLHGGKLAHPLYAYGDGVEQFCDTPPEGWSVELPDGGKYWEYDFLTENRSKGDNLGLSTEEGNF